MNSLLAIIPIAAAAFVATNLDNFVLLVSLLARFRRRPLGVIGGYLACMFILGAIGYLIGGAANSAPVQYLGLLGLIPVSIGVIGIVRLLPGHSNDSSRAPSGSEGGSTAFVTTLLSQLGNGADTIVTLGILFADSLPSADVLIVATIVVMAIAFAVMAVYALRHPGIGRSIERYGDRVTPFILLFVGGYVLFNTGTDIMPG